MTDKVDKFQVPEPGEDWLWWHPDEPLDQDARFGGMSTITCKRCDVRWNERITQSSRPRCFSCGRFMRKPLRK